MEDGILFLGTGGDAMTVGKNYRNSAGIILRLQGNQFHIDPGPNSLYAMRVYDINVRENTAVFVTSSNLNHCNDINAVIYGMTYDGLDKHGLLVAPESFREEDTPLTEKYMNCVERCIWMNEDSRIAINEVEIIPLMGKPGLGMKFISEDVTVAYTSDSQHSASWAEQFSDCDVLIINCRNPSGKSEKGHLNMEDVEKLLTKAKPKMAILTNFGIELLKQDPIGLARTLQKKTKTQVLAATDGLFINPQTFASKLRQKKLTKFKE